MSDVRSTDVYQALDTGNDCVLLMLRVVYCCAVVITNTMRTFVRDNSIVDCEGCGCGIKQELVFY